MNALQLEHLDDIAVAAPAGDIDAANAATVEEELGECLTPDAMGLVVDLSQVRYLDSAGIDMLLRLGERLRQRRTALRLVVSVDSQLRRLFEIVSLADTIPLHASVNDATSAVAAGSQPPAPAGESQPAAE
jgi:anti-sigma B factor antagonist